MSATLTNGRQRKSLAEQIDRLDSVLDGLADGLNEAVATAVKEAVRAVLTEVLTNPELLARLHPVQAIAVPEPPQPSRWLARAWDGIRSALRWTAAQGPCWLAVARPGVRQRPRSGGRDHSSLPRQFRAAPGCRRLRAAPRPLALGTDPGRGSPGRLDWHRGLSPGSVDGGGRQRGRWFGDGIGAAPQRILVPLGLAVAPPRND